MNTRDFDFADIVRPLSPERFFREHWEKRPLVLARGEPTAFEQLFSLEELEEVLWSTRPGWGVVQLANHRRGEGWIDFTRGPPTLDRLGHAYGQGDTIVLNDLQLRSRKVAALCRAFEALFNFPVNVNLYLTPAGAQGLSPHFDTQETFILQISGVKHWRLYPPAVHLPSAELARDVPEADVGAAETFELRAGDVLYMPRGVVHEALAVEEDSLHLTVGITVLSWRDLLGELLQIASEQDVGFREALPTGMAARPTELREGVQALLARLTGSADISEAADRLAWRYLAQVEPLPDANLRQRAEARALALGTRVRRREGMFCRVRTREGTTRIEYPGNRLEAPAAVEPTLRFIAEVPEFAIGELPGNLGDESRLMLVRRLIADGLLLVSHP
jgi:ribosomal protein L16 Arg81 hydroxylase